MLEIVALVVICTIALTDFHTFIERAVFLKGAIHKTFITTTEDVTVTFGHS